MLPHNSNHRIDVRTSWWGLGAIIAASTSHLVNLKNNPTFFWWSQWYTHEEKPNTNIFEWFYEQPQELITSTFREWDTATLEINGHQTPEFVKLARRRWKEVLGKQVDKLGCFQRAFELLCNAPSPNVLGVHYRGTDKRNEVPILPAEQIVKNIRQIQSSRNLPTVLVCTDDQNFLTYCISQVTGVIYFPDHLRVVGTVGLHQKLGSPRQCAETMTEILALGLCRHLYLGRSCVADSALFLSQDNTTWEYYS
jgi:hypothetical protein